MIGVYLRWIKPASASCNRYEMCFFHYFLFVISLPLLSTVLISLRHLDFIKKTKSIREDRKQKDQHTLAELSSESSVSPFNSSYGDFPLTFVCNICQKKEERTKKERGGLSQLYCKEEEEKE